MPSIQPIKSVNVAGTVHPLDKTFTLLSGITTVAGNGNSGSYKSVRWYVSGVEGVTTPYNGMKIAIKVPLSGVGTAGAVLSINGNTDAEYHPLAYNVNTVLTTHFPVNSIKVFIYDANQTMDAYLTSNTKVTITGVWKAESNYDSNTTLTYGTLAYYFRPYAAQTIYRYKFVMLDKDNRLVPLTITNVANGTAVTNQTPTDKAFRPEKIYWYNATGTINAGAAVGGNTLVSIGYNANNSTNGGMAVCNFNSTIAAYRMIYLCGNYNKSTGLFTLRDGGTASSTNYYVQVPTNTANLNLSTYFNSSYDYILLGGTYSSNTYIHLMDNNPMYYFDGTNLIPYNATDTDTGATSIETTGTGNVVSSASYDASTRKITLTKSITALTSHQSIKTLKTDNTTAQTASSSEAIAGSGTINLHKIAKTGTYSDLIGTPIPGDSGEIKTKYRCSVKGHTGADSTAWYYKLCTLPVSNSGNYASVIISGRIGGWTASNLSSIYCLGWNRDSCGFALLDLGGAGTMASIFARGDLVMYTNTDNTVTVYVKTTGYFTFDLNVELYQSTATIDFDETYVTSPSGTLATSASTSTSRLQLEQGVLKINGTAVQSKISALGAATQPVYFSSDGVASTCSTYAGGTAVTLNGTSKAASTASFYAPTSVGTNGQLLSSNGSSLVWTNDNRGLLHHDLNVEIANTTTDSGWSMFNSTYNGYLLKSVRFNAQSPAWGVGNYGSGIVFGGVDTKGVISVSYGAPQIKIAGGNGNFPVWWIKLTGTSAASYNLDKLNNLGTQANYSYNSSNGTLTITTL